VPKKKFKDYPIGYLHVAFAQVRTEEGRQYLFVAIDFRQQSRLCRTAAPRMIAANFLRRVLEKLPYKAHTVLTDNGVQFTLQPPQWFAGGHRFDRICRAFGVEHRLTNPAHPWRGLTARSKASTARSKKPPCRATTTRPRPNLTSTCTPFCWPTTMPSAANACAD
jgi:hypothetical protein